MQTYVVLRRSGWHSQDALQQAAERSGEVGSGEMKDDVRWIRTYVFDEADGTLGTACVYQANSPEALKEHAALADLPADEILPVMNTLILEPDPETAD